jgi:hypothetical protein
MKSFRIFILFALFFSVNQGISHAKCSTMCCKEDSSIVISPIPGNNPDPPIPRTPMFVPISASYDTMLTSVSLYFTHDLGEIEIEVLNSTTGGYNSGIVDSQYLSAIIPITMGPGHYTITFTLPSGQQYQGEFDV